MLRLIQPLIKRFSNLKMIKVKLLIVLSFFVFWLFCFNWTSYHEVSIERNFFTGTLLIDTNAGPNFSAPWIQVSNIDTRTKKLCIDCSCRTMNCRLVQFNKEGTLNFVLREGFRYYWWTNRFSFNSGNDNEYRGMDFILRGYAFDSEKHPFLNMIKE